MKYIEPLMIMFFCFVICIVVSCSDSSTIHDGTVKGGALSGRVIDQNSTGVPNVIINVKGVNGSFSMQSNENGYFSITLFEGGSYILTPVLGTGLFEPLTIVKELSGSDISDINFTLTSSQLTFNPTSATISSVGETTTMNIYVNYIRRLISAQLTLSFDPAIVEVSNVKTSGDGFFFTDADVFVVELIKNIDNVNGRVNLSIGGLKDEFTGVSGNGKLVSFTLKGKKAGTSPLTLVNDNPDDIILAHFIEGSIIGVGIYFKNDATVTVK